MGGKDLYCILEVLYIHAGKGLRLNVEMTWDDGERIMNRELSSQVFTGRIIRFKYYINGVMFLQGRLAPWL